MKNIGFIGLGKLGLDCAEVFAEKHRVRGYDVAPRQSQSVEICDIDELVNSSEWIFIAVPTPHAEGYDGSVPSSHMEPRDFGHDAVKDAIVKINQHARSPKKVVLISTVLPGTTRRYFVPLLDPQHQFLYNPYLIAMGSVKWDMVNPEMVMIGTQDGNPTALAHELVEIYQTIMQNDPRYEIGTWDECEAIKIFYNTFISAKVGLANMIQDFAMRIGNINVDVVTDALARSTMRIMGPKYMTAGMGDAGACVLPNFEVEVDEQIIKIVDLYQSFQSDQTRLIKSTNYAITKIDEKKISKVTCRDYDGEILRFIKNDEILLECTPEHLVPVNRNGTRLIIRADEIKETDKLYRLS